MMVGRTLSRYKILEKLGSGGMGEVYVAEDAKLGRRVALKVLPPEMATGERRMRFEREAQAIAALNHPNIVHIYSVEESEGVYFITMELVKGKTLTELIPKNGLPLHQFFEIAIPLSDAVSAADEKGIIHRDLKPDNLMVSDEGRLKILDFGLAKLKQELGGKGVSELPTRPATQEGKILGTVAYMSPEQAEGKTVDHRSDIFSIGIILYEMATGERPFKGDSTASILSSILKDTPQSATQVNPNLPRDLGKIIRRSLAKDPDERLQTTKELRNELKELKQEVESGEVLEGVRAPTRRNRWTVPAWVALGALMAGAIVYLLLSGRVDEQATGPAVQGTFTQLTSQPGPEYFPSLSPDGEFFVYSSTVSGNADIYFQRVGGEKPMNLTESSLDDDYAPAFSPDGRHIAFRSEREGGGLFVMRATGESVRRLTDFGYNPAWSPDGEQIAFATEGVTYGTGRATTSQLWTVNVADGDKRLITERDVVQPSWSPHGHRIAFWSIEEESGRRTGQRDLWTMPASGGGAVRVTEDAPVDWNPVWSPDGRYLYFSSDRGGTINLWRILIDEESGSVLGEPEAVTSGASAWHRHISISRDGTRIAYVEQVRTRKIQKIALDPTAGTAEGSPLPVTRGTRSEGEPAISPDGEWLAFREETENQGDIFIMRPDGTGRRQLTDDPYQDRGPLWSPGGKKIGFYSNRSGPYEIWTINPDGSELKQLTETSLDAVNYAVWSPDGQRMAFYNRSQSRSYIIDLDKTWQEQTPEALPPPGEASEAFEVWSWSPDGIWLAGFARRSDGTIAGIALFHLESKQYRMLANFGRSPLWLSDSRRILFCAENKLFLLDIESGSYEEIFSISPDVMDIPSITSDDRWIYFDRSSVEADIWMLTLGEASK
jgi:Tol biopolymer transport system component